MILKRYIVIIYNMENSKDNTISIIKEYYPNMSDVTIGHHIARIRMIKKVISDGDFEDFDAEFLDNNPKNIVKAINDKWANPQTSRTYLYTCVTMARALNMDQKIIDIYYNARDIDEKKVKKHYDSKEFSDKQNKNYTQLYKINNVISNLKKKIDILFRDTKIWILPKIKQVREYIILLIYQNFRFRNDIANMKYMIMENEIEIDDLYDDDANYLVYDEEQEEMFFLINVYKTNKIYGTKKVMIPPSIEFELTRYMAINKTPFVVFNNSGLAATSHELTILLSLITKKYFNGKSITSTMFNVIVETTKFSLQEKERMKHARERGQSLEVQHKYIKVPTGREYIAGKNVPLDKKKRLLINVKNSNNNNKAQPLRNQDLPRGPTKKMMINVKKS